MIENCYMLNERDKCINSNIWKTHLLIFSSNLHDINEIKKEKCLELSCSNLKKPFMFSFSHITCLNNMHR